MCRKLDGYQVKMTPVRVFLVALFCTMYGECAISFTGLVPDFCLVFVSKLQSSHSDIFMFFNHAFHTIGFGIGPPIKSS